MLNDRDKNFKTAKTVGVKTIVNANKQFNRMLTDKGMGYLDLAQSIKSIEAEAKAYTGINEIFDGAIAKNIDPKKKVVLYKLKVFALKKELQDVKNSAYTDALLDWNQKYTKLYAEVLILRAEVDSLRQNAAKNHGLRLQLSKTVSQIKILERKLAGAQEEHKLDFELKEEEHKLALSQKVDKIETLQKHNKSLQEYISDLEGLINKQLEEQAADNVPSDVDNEEQQQRLLKKQMEAAEKKNIKLGKLILASAFVCVVGIAGTIFTFKNVIIPLICCLIDTCKSTFTICKS